MTKAFLCNFEIFFMKCQIVYVLRIFEMCCVLFIIIICFSCYLKFSIACSFTICILFLPFRFILFVIRKMLCDQRVRVGGATAGGVGQHSKKRKSEISENKKPLILRRNGWPPPLPKSAVYPAAVYEPSPATERKDVREP